MESTGGANVSPSRKRKAERNRPGSPAHAAAATARSRVGRPESTVVRCGGCTPCLYGTKTGQYKKKCKSPLTVSVRTHMRAPMRAQAAHGHGSPGDHACMHARTRPGTVRVHEGHGTVWQLRVAASHVHVAGHMMLAQVSGPLLLCAALTCRRHCCDWPRMRQAPPAGPTLGDHAIGGGVVVTEGWCKLRHADLPCAWRPMTRQPRLRSPRAWLAGQPCMHACAFAMRTRVHCSTSTPPASGAPLTKGNTNESKQTNATQTDGPTRASYP